MHLVTFDLAADFLAAEADTRADRTGHFTDSALGLATLDFMRSGSRRLGAVLPAGPQAGDVVDLNRALAVRLACEDVGAPEAEADSLLPPSMGALLAGGAPVMAFARSAFTWAVESLRRYDRPDLVRGGVILPRRQVRLRAPVPRPGKVLGVARNYAAHAGERGSEPPEEPVLFVKASSAVIGPREDIELPAASHAVDFEGELAAVIGRPTRHVSAEQALEHVAGYTIANDVTARDFQDARGQRFLGKSCDTFAPMGPCLVTRDAVDDPQKLRLETRVSGEVRQSAMTSEMIFPVAEIVAFVSRLMTLHPGDVILAGTPAGVGAASVPPRFLREGDLVEVEIDGLGCLRNTVRAERLDALPRG